jgi:hypothetical protein
MSRVRLVQGVGQRPYFGNTGNTGKREVGTSMALCGPHRHGASMRSTAAAIMAPTIVWYVPL